MSLKTTKHATTKNLFQHAFDLLALLKAGAVTVEEAKAHAGLLKQSNNLLKYELDRAIAIQKFEHIEIRNIEDGVE